MDKFCILNKENYRWLEKLQNNKVGVKFARTKTKNPFRLHKQIFLLQTEDNRTNV